MSEDIKITNISIHNYKALYDVSFEPGNVNVLIGANGSGKSTVLEAIGTLSAAMTDRVNSSSMQRKGVRLSSSQLYKSRFLDIGKEPLTIDFQMNWQKNTHDYQYSVHLTVPTDDDSWKYHSESVLKDGKAVFGRSNRSKSKMNSRIGYYSLAEVLASEEYISAGRYIGNYGIYQPDTLTLRGTVADPTQVFPIGLNGGRLAEAVSDLLKVVDEDLKFGSLYMSDVLELIEWASEFRVGKPKKSTINSGVPAASRLIEFQDRYLKDTALFTGYDASEGALYVLFMLCIAMHPKAPQMIGIDSFDHAMNPRLARRITQIFSRLILENDKTVFMTTHNPLVLDGLDLTDERIRLFVTDRDENGHIVINRIQVSEELIRSGQPLSRLWINVYLGGVPELI